MNVKVKGLFLQLEIGNQVYFSAVIDGTDGKSFQKVWEAAGPKIYERLREDEELSRNIASGYIRICPIVGP